MVSLAEFVRSLKGIDPVPFVAAAAVGTTYLVSDAILSRIHQKEELLGRLNKYEQAATMLELKLSAVYSRLGVAPPEASDFKNKSEQKPVEA